jgi:transcriptional regulator GlxA family with amidase domain
MRRIVFVIFDGFQLLDLTGPHEVFQHASPLSAGYDCQVVSRTPGPVRSGSGLPVHASHGVDELDPGGIDTLVVAGGPGVDLARADRALVDWVRAAGTTSRRVTAVCSGVFLLAAAGLVSGRRVTTHWSRARQLADEHPELIVDCDPIFIQDGRVWTSAGVSAALQQGPRLYEGPGPGVSVKPNSMACWNVACAPSSSPSWPRSRFPKSIIACDTYRGCRVSMARWKAAWAAVASR